ncbi:hypothetical protein MGYG_00751 [Nannizzia gypsea CBS 118893]|uniref:NAD dependent epimerase/dehydratase n=1 Tax=Arthroderma gypseum (strain ATCC MYA-4604 / CBS 118893) TaxID=535722 RepID=E5R1L3_ARTGP|nr:hypothetical protein MGYG_00751 [Nannizzia gypsea CBS 118893]EFQ97711.1 hypothetical protein MGYG_00751 [Nannizzia gypsea CBS 118893]
MAPHKPRLIDKEISEGVLGGKQVSVLCLGMCRTRTSSLMAALSALGYTPIHMSTIIEDTRQKTLWIEGIENTFINKETGRPYGRAEFDVLLRGYDVTLDVPCAIFGEQLMAAYPEAKVILTTRPAGKWIASMQKTVWQFITWSSFRMLRYLEPEFIGTFHRLLELIFLVHNGNHYGGEEAEQAYHAHNKRIRELAGPERLLELSPPFDIEKLSAFLGKPCTHSEFPHVNDSSECIESLYRRRNQSIALVMKRLGKIFLVCLPLALPLVYRYVAKQG